MALAASDYFIPRTSFVPYILEDLYIKGGFRVFKTLADRDTYIQKAKQLAFFEDFDSRKVGMLCCVIDENRQIYQLDTNKESWTLFKPGGEVTVAEPLYNNNGTIHIRENVLLPTPAPGTPAGSSVVLDADMRPVWAPPAGGQPGMRGKVPIVFPVLDAGQSATYLLDIAATVILLELEVNMADFKVEIFSTVDMDDENPYTFISADGYLSDQGIKEQNGQLWKFRRFSILANLETPVIGRHYVKVTNMNPIAAVPTVDIHYLELQ